MSATLRCRYMFYSTEALKKWLEDEASETDISVSLLMRQILVEHIKLSETSKNV